MHALKAGTGAELFGFVGGGGEEDEYESRGRGDRRGGGGRGAGRGGGGRGAGRGADRGPRQQDRGG